MTDILMEADDVSKQYSSGWLAPAKTDAVSQVSWRIMPGQSWALAGPNGAGKSSLLRCMVGLAQPTAGQVALFGETYGTSRFERLGYLPELFAAYPKLTVAECLRYYGKLSGLSDGALASRLPAILEEMGLKDCATKRVANLSKGLVQRLGLGQSLLHEPDLLVWDEPTTGLDPLGRRLVAEIAAKHKQAGKTLLVATHIMTDIQRICDHIAIMVGGVMRACGPIDALQSQYQVASVEDLFFTVTKEQAHAK